MPAIDEKPDPAICPLCSGPLLVAKSRVAANGVTTQYRRCECGVKVTDRVRKIVVPVGRRRIVTPAGEILFQSNPHPAESAAAAIPSPA